MKYKIYQSTIFRVVVITILLVLPINIMTLLLSELAIEKQQEQSAKEIQATLELNAEIFSESLSRISKKQTYLSFRDTNMIALSNLKATSSMNEKGALLSKVKQDLTALKLDYPMIDLLYYQFPQVDFTLCEGYPGIPYQACRIFIKETWENKELLAHKWQTDRIDNVDVLFSFQSWKQTNFGIIVNLERLLERMKFPEGMIGRDIFFTNTSETFYTATGESLFDQLSATLSELEQSKQYKVFKTPIEQSDLVLVEVVDWKQQRGNIPSTIEWFYSISIVMAIVAIPLLLLYIRRSVIRPLNKLVNAIDRVEQGDLNYRIPQAKTGREFEQINQNFNTMMEQVKDLKIDIYDKELEKNNIRMQYLSQQIQPHFILNAMNIIYSYEPEEYPLIQKLVLCISKYFRYIVKTNSDFVTLQQEMEHIENYFQIQKARFPDYFVSSVEYSSSLEDALIPPLILQTFAENAIKHSLQVDTLTTIRVCAERFGADNKKMRIIIADTGVGISESVIESIHHFQQTGIPQENLGVGIQNTMERLRYFYHEEARLHIQRGADGQGTHVELIMPLHTDEQREDEIH